MQRTAHCVPLNRSIKILTGKRILKSNLTSFLLALCLTPSISAAQDPLDCSKGPVIGTYGQSEWLVYSCNDGSTLVFVATQGSPAHPFYFILAKVEGNYRLHGEGTGKKEATAAALAEIQALTQDQIAGLISQTRER